MLYVHLRRMCILLCWMEWVFYKMSVRFSWFMLLISLLFLLIFCELILLLREEYWSFQLRLWICLFLFSVLSLFFFVYFENLLFRAYEHIFLGLSCPLHSSLGLAFFFSCNNAHVIANIFLVKLTFLHQFCQLCSILFSHLSTNQAQPCSASKFRWDRVCLGWYGLRP